MQQTFNDGETLANVRGIINSNADDVTERMVSRIENVADLRNFEPGYNDQCVFLIQHTSGAKGGGLVYYDASDSTTPDDDGLTFVTSGGARWKRRYLEVIDVQIFGAIGDGVVDDYDAIQAALDTGRSVYFPAGTYLINTGLVAENQSFTGENWRLTTIKTAATIVMLTANSSTVVEDIQFNGSNGDATGIQAPFGNRVNVNRVRIEYMARGLEVLDMQNSLFSDVYLRYCDFNLYIDGAENCKFLNMNGAFDNIQRAILSTSRNILVTDAVYGTVRNLNFFGGIFERGGTISDYCMEVTGATNMALFGTELNGGGLGVVKQNGTSDLRYTDCDFSLLGTNPAIVCDDDSTYTLRGSNASGSGGRDINGLIVGGITREIDFGEFRFDYGDLGWVNSSGGSFVYNATTRSLDLTTASTAQGTRYTYASGTPFDPNILEGRYYIIEVILSDISTANPCGIYVSLPISPFRRLLGTATDGYNKLVVPSDIDDGLGFEVTGEEVAAKTFKLRYFHAQIV